MCTCDAKAKRDEVFAKFPKGSAERKRKISHKPDCEAQIEFTKSKQLKLTSTV